MIVHSRQVVFPIDKDSQDAESAIQKVSDLPGEREFASHRTAEMKGDGNELERFLPSVI